MREGCSTRRELWNAHCLQILRLVTWLRSRPLFRLDLRLDRGLSGVVTSRSGVSHGAEETLLLGELVVFVAVLPLEHMLRTLDRLWSGLVHDLNAVSLDPIQMVLGRKDIMHKKERRGGDERKQSLNTKLRTQQRSLASVKVA